MTRKISNEVADVVNTGENVQGVPLPEPTPPAPMADRTSWYPREAGDPDLRERLPEPETEERLPGDEPPDRTRR